MCLAGAWPAAAAGAEGVLIGTVTLYRLSGLAVMIGMTIDGLASVLYSRAGGVPLYLDPLMPVNDLAKLSGSLIFLIGLPGLYAFQADEAGRLGLAGFVLSFAGLALLEVGTEAMFAFTGPVLAAHDPTRFLLHARTGAESRWRVPGLFHPVLPGGRGRLLSASVRPRSGRVSTRAGPGR